ncbi:type VI secretion system protein TssA [Pseudomonas sp. Fl4BN1]|uniref:type VI secretion system protein TssA n=1 Tax=Pseudomonas sp. Fl4BN1 TaxID=2697651 RepID=UPI001377685B|nr:type VI secretion system protein TssA [Pseudomonas sp. Fl4BN1]
MDVPMLLAAISATSPCGEDLEYHADFLHLERAAQGQPERSMGDSTLPAEPPDWRSIQQQSLDLLARSKDLRITHFLLQSTLALEGLPGLATSLELINGLLRDYWAELHPHLDADDDNDPTVRINALAGLAADATIGLLREAILTRSRTFGPVSVRAALNAAGLQHFSGESLASDHLAGALQDSDPQHLETIRHALSSARSAAESIEQQVSEQVGSASGVDLTALKQPLRQALQVLGQHAPQAAGHSADESTENPAPEHSGTPVAPAQVRVCGEINSREDVLRSLDRLLAYYSRCEPSSPLPVLLTRAKHLVNADFASIVRNLIPDGMSQFENLRGPESD